MNADRLEGLGRDASDLIKIMMWADDDPRKLARLYLRYPNASRITVPMVERFLGEERTAWIKKCNQESIAWMVTQ